MDNYQFRKPLFQAAFVIVAFLIFFLFVNAAHPANIFEAIVAIFGGVFSSFIFLFGLGVAVLVSITILVTIFLLAVALYSPEQSAELYSKLRQNIGRVLTELQACCSCSESRANEHLQELDTLTTNLDKSNVENIALMNSITSLKSQLLEKDSQAAILISGQTALTLEKEELLSVKEVLEEEKVALATQVEQANNKLGTATVEKSALSNEIKELKNQVEELQKLADQAPVAGIFSYFENEEDKTLFADKVEEAVNQELTYAQIDEFLAENLPAEIHAIAKDHPSLTKNYIRNLRR